ncbi:MAG: hypothetical protein ACYCW6_31260 [Candidatus Xenobia bacterium]
MLKFTGHPLADEVEAESDEEALRIAAGGQYDIDDIFDPHDFTPVEVVQ